jgi:hypothetical protein
MFNLRSTASYIWTIHLFYFGNLRSMAIDLWVVHLFFHNLSSTASDVWEVHHIFFGNLRSATCDVWAVHLLFWNLRRTASDVWAVRLLFSKIWNFWLSVPLKIRWWYCRLSHSMDEKASKDVVVSKINYSSMLPTRQQLNLVTQTSRLSH